jgi:hypothetical protein
MDVLSELEKGDQVDLNAQARMREKLFLGPKSNGTSNPRSEKKGVLVVKKPVVVNQPGIGPTNSSTDSVKPDTERDPIDLLLPPGINSRNQKHLQSALGAEFRILASQANRDHAHDSISRDKDLSSLRDRTALELSFQGISKRNEEGEAKHSDDPAESDMAAAPNLQQGTAATASDKDPLQLLSRLIKKPNSTEFWYLRKYEADCMTPLNPYHIEIVPHSEISGKDYFTMSSHGVTHFEDGIPDFTPLLRWRREYEVFVKLRKIPVFGKYRFWKPYKVWKLVVHYGKMRKHQELLTKKLFLLDPVFQKLLLQIRGLCEDLRSSTLHSFDPDKLYELPGFVEEQQVQRAAFMQRLEAFWRAGIAHATQACADTLDALDEKLFKSKSKSAALAAAGSTGPAKGASAGAAAATIPKDDVSNFRYTVMASKRIEHQRLFHLLRACDYIVSNTLHEMVISAMQSLLLQATDAPPPAPPGSASTQEPTLEEPEEDGGGGGGGETGGGGAQVRAHFVTEVLLEEGELRFAPSPGEFEGGLDRTFDGFIDAVGADIRLVTYPDLRVYTSLYESDADLSEAATVGDVVNNDDRYQKLRDGLLTAVAQVRAPSRTRTRTRTRTATAAHAHTSIGAHDHAHAHAHIWSAPTQTYAPPPPLLCSPPSRRASYSPPPIPPRPTHIPGPGRGRRSRRAIRRSGCTSLSESWWRSTRPWTPSRCRGGWGEDGGWARKGRREREGRGEGRRAGSGER